ncbi:hypothetical protein LY622_05820 [Halomonas sp. M5N1S17]|nr:hypothetical protein [Halomonas alkalisoli]MCE9662953.1 hypothetical protein [Halomonas alkalisoli]
MFAQRVERSARLRLQEVCHLLDGVGTLRCRRVSHKALEYREVVDVALHREQGLDIMRLVLGQTL